MIKQLNCNLESSSTLEKGNSDCLATDFGTFETSAAIQQLTNLSWKMVFLWFPMEMTHFDHF
jgi:hypothetical protein